MRKLVPYGLVTVFFLAVRLAFAATGATAVVPPTGMQLTSPVVICGSFNYNGGTQVSAVPACGGTVVLTSGAGTVANANVDANSVIILTLKTPSGTVAAPFVATITPGTGFTVGGGGSDNSTYNYVILG